MYRIAIISGSARMNRQTPKAVKALTGYLEKHALVSEVIIIDVLKYDLPIMYERRGRHPNPPAQLDEIGQIIESVDALVIGSPEYNGSFSGAVKNLMDYFFPEYARTPIGVMTVSGGGRGGINASHDLQKYILALKGFPMPYKLLVPHIRKSIDDDGAIQDNTLAKSFERFADELLWLTDAIAQKKKSEGS